MKESVTIQLCPQCKRATLDWYAAAITGSYWCKHCGYQGTLILEKKRRTSSS